MKRCIQLRISGKVQGVFYRAMARDKAKDLDIGGWVMNEPDGDVLIEAEGEDEALKTFEDWCSLGPARAKVDRVVVTFADIKTYSEFVIRR